MRIELDLSRLGDAIGGFVGKENRVLEALARGYEGHLKDSMRQPKSGRTYGAHVASAPGEAPAVDTGHLIASIVTEPAGPHAWQVATDVEYAAFLEYGTRRMAARPAWHPAVDAVMADAEKIAVDATA